MTALKIIDLKKEFNGKFVSNGIDLEIPKGEITVIVGRSGEGKSVFLKQLIGLIQPTSGKIIVDGVDTTHLSEEQRSKFFQNFGYVFQFAALLDSLDIFQNIGISLLEHGESEHTVLPIVKEQLNLVNLQQDVLHKFPSELSGGMRKRVGLARTLVSKPNVILYDEPTTGLDPITTRVIHELMFDMHKKLHMTSIVISHDIEIFKYADNVALLHDGKIRYYGSAKTVWESENPYIYQFIRGLEEGPMQIDTKK